MATVMQHRPESSHPATGREQRLLMSLNPCIEVELPPTTPAQGLQAGLLHICRASPLAVDMLGADDASQLAGMPLNTLADSDSIGPINAVLNAAARGDEAAPARVTLRRLDGQPIALRMAAASWGPGTISLLFAPTMESGGHPREETRTQPSLTAFARAARLALMGELTASIAHEVTQPLSAITVNSGTALKWLEKDPPDITRAMARISRVVADAERTAAIVHGMRKLASGAMGERRAIDLNHVAQDALSFVQDEARLHGVTLRLLPAPALPPLQGDAVQLQQVVVNLVLNAIQAIAQAGSASRSITIRIAAAPDGAALLSIQDSGPGIAAPHLSRLFESFFTTKPDGIGMGLAICRSIVENHGGTLTLENAPGGGALAMLRIAPVSPDEETIPPLPWAMDATPIPCRVTPRSGLPA